MRRKRNRRLERMLREAAIAEDTRRQEESQREQSSSQPEPNPFALVPGFVALEEAAFEGMNRIADMSMQAFQNCFKAIQRT